jgi:hypothetical protein
MYGPALREQAWYTPELMRRLPLAAHSGAPAALGLEEG